MVKDKKPAKKSYTPLPAGALRVALLGRPNVGKSTLFNRLIRSKRAITHDMPGVTRDRMEGRVRNPMGGEFILVDTGGITLDAHAVPVEGPAGIRGFESEILEQARLAVTESDLLCLVVDGRDGLTPLDAHLADYLRRSGKPLLLLVNKVDGPERADLMSAEFHILGFELIPCSAEHGYNIGGLIEAITDRLPIDDDNDADEPQAGKTDTPEVDNDDPAEAAFGPDGESLTEAEFDLDGDADEFAADADDASAEDADSLPLGDAEKMTEAAAASSTGDDPVEEEDGGPLRLAMLGRPNVGKSSLVNALTRQSRMIVSPIAGTTRDSVDVSVEIDGVDCVFVDSAGVRRKAKINDSVERFSVNSALKTSSKAQVTLLVLDGQEGLTQQDKRLLELLDGRKLPFIVLVNKSDLMKPQELAEIEKTYRQELSYCRHIPLLLVSANDRRNLRRIVPLAQSILKESRLRVGTGQLNRFLEQLLQQRQPPLIKQRRAKFYYMTQAESSPPTFVFFVSDLERVPDSYVRYLERSLRQMLGLKHAPIRIHFRPRGKKAEA
ncbi:MAG: ribosome biogenesis GTPase Der [Deltaproteobacteria bacterium]|jgi:GTP-binding protein|nr:ribosome biogenesis GTPase Der [Deltaproteobacteria bacterium]